ncbi:peptidylprolyl isomerase [bacterium]|nr:peptidylprolyl isomerase [bacterium]
MGVIETSLGEIVLRFYPESAPMHVERVKAIIASGEYNNVQFHRVIPGFVVQAGDPTTADSKTQRREYGKNGTGVTLPAEFNELKHLPGRVGMARGDHDINSADSQWYICLDTLAHLDGRYTIFAEVIEGMDVVHKIASVETDAHDIPLEPVRINSVKLSSYKDAVGE